MLPVSFGLFATTIAWLAELGWWSYFVWSGRLLGACFIPSVILQPKIRPLAAVAWILALLFVPYLGVALWWTMGRNQMRRRQKHHRRATERISEHLDNLEQAVRPRPFNGDDRSDLDRIFASRRLILQDEHNLFPATDNNTVVHYPGARPAFDAFEDAIEEADDHIHFLFYVWRDDETGRRFRDLLARRAQDGLEVRVLYDSVGSVSIGRRFTQPLTDAGAQVASFMPVRIWERRLRVNFRNHRKLLIVDGRCAFTGGVNIADEYLEWFDMAFGFRGPIVHQMQQVFVEDWYSSTGEKLARTEYFPHLERRQRLQKTGETEEIEQTGAIHLLDESSRAFDTRARFVASGPDDHFETIHKMFFSAATSARRRLDVITPYFVPDEAMSTALQTAAMQGVDVRILLPAQTDVVLTQHAGRSFWEPLLEAGVRLFEYRKRILHAKLLVIDDRHVIAGSANMDLRSFRLNFEANAIIDDRRFNRQMSGVFERAIDNSDEVDLDAFRDRPRRTRLLEGLARLFSPLL